MLYKKIIINLLIKFKPREIVRIQNGRRLFPGKLILIIPNTENF